MGTVVDSTKHYAVYEEKDDGWRKLDYSFDAVTEGVTGAMWALAQHHGGGTYVAVEVPKGEHAYADYEDTLPESRVYRLSHAWLEE